MSFRPCLHETGTELNRDENRIFQHVNYMRPVRNHEISPTRVTPAVLAQFFTLALSRLFVSVYFIRLYAHAFFGISNRSEMHFVFTFMPV